MADFFPIGGTANYASPQIADISADGKVAVGSVLPATRAFPFRWTAQEGIQTLETGTGRYAGAAAVSADGGVIVGGNDSVRGQAFRWTEDDGTQYLGGLPDREVLASYATAVSSDGGMIFGGVQIVGILGAHAFRWTQQDGMRDLGFAGTIGGVSADGATIAGHTPSPSGQPEAFRWTAHEGLQGLGNLGAGEPGSYSVATDISADGTTVVGQSWSPFRQEAFRWTAQDGMQGLGDLPGGNFSSYAYAVSADGRFIVGSSDSAVGPEAFIWDAEHGMRGLQQLLIDEESLAAPLRGWRLTRATAISEDGSSIAGAGTWDYHTPHTPTAWLVRLDQTNTAPEALNDRALAQEDHAIVIGVLANDRDADGDSLTVTAILTPPQHGTVVLNADGTLTYSPAPDYFGEDTFTYRMGDGRGGSDEASVAVTVTAMPETASLVLQTRSGTFLYSEDDPAYAAAFTAASRGAISDLGASIPISFGASDGSAEAAAYLAFNKGLGVAGVGDSGAQKSQIEGAEELRLAIDAGERGFDKGFGTLVGVEDAGLAITQVKTKGHEPAVISVQAFREGQLVDEETFVFADKARDHVLPFASTDAEDHPAAFDTLVLMAGNAETAFSFRAVVLDLDANVEALIA